MPHVLRRSVTILYALLLAICLWPSALLAEEASGSWIQSQISHLNEVLGETVGLIFAFLFYDFGTGFPLIIAVLVLGGIY